MYNANTIRTEFSTLVGWRQNEDPNGVQLTDLLTTDSGLYFNDEHPLLSIDNLIGIAPDFDNITYNAWDSGTTYGVGAIVTNGGVKYRSILGNTNQSPPNPTYWEVYSPFTEWLTQKTQAGILRAFTNWVAKKMDERTAASLLDRSVMFRASGKIDDDDVDYGRWVGIEILPARSRNLKLTIRRLSLQFTANEDVTVYLFDSKSINPVKTVIVSYAGSRSEQWVDLSDWDLPGDRVHYVMYDQAAQTGVGVNGARDYFQNVGGKIYFPMNKFWGASPVSVPDTGGQMWDTSANSYSVDTNYGLNLDISAECDYTNLFVEQKLKFAPLIAKQVAADLLRELAYNPASRVNRHQANADRPQLLYELDGDSKGREGGIKAELKSVLNATSMDLSNMDSICLPCRRKGSRWRLA